MQITINLDAKSFKKVFKSRAFIITALVLLIGTVVFAVTKPYDFTDGDIASAAEFNSNFDTVYGKVTELEAEVSALTAATNSMQTAINDHESRLSGMESLLNYVSRIGTEMYFTGVNVSIRNGLGNTGTVNGLGNLIVGYDEDNGDTKTGSHNLIVGEYHSYTNYGGFVAGYDNNIFGGFSSVSGGSENTASGWYSSVSGGSQNTAGGDYSSVSGGAYNSAGSTISTVSGGLALTNTTPAQHLP